MNPLVSFIIPVYNVKEYLSKCITSILEQDGQIPFEIILINDGSDDGSGNICDNFANKINNIKVFHKKNEGVSIARNLGLDLAKGKYISFVDSDDILASTYLTTVMDLKYPADIIFFGCDLFYPTEKYLTYLPRARYETTQNNIEDAIWGLRKNEQKFEFFGYTWSKCFKKSIIDEFNIRFIPGLKIREDELFTLNYCAHIKTLKIVDKALYIYRVTNNGLTNSLRNSEEYNLFANKLLNLSSLFSYAPLRNDLIDSVFIHKYIALCNSRDHYLKNVYLDEIKSIIQNKTLKYKPVSKKNRLFFLINNWLWTKKIIKFLSTIEKNKY